ncbi:hypothetical protein EVJ58_g1386 [Rhodofomes roseus]|uniref:Uncharacterized protein n=1 Tax=Rhodofomes roseus TaxID=34475 RepID=A0A4Y9YZM0_9APHY|nr:hypothetical protein EVJ58_g1386 [Rhodofomes roseus]
MRTHLLDYAQDFVSALRLLLSINHFDRVDMAGYSRPENFIGVRTPWTCINSSGMSAWATGSLKTVAKRPSSENTLTRGPVRVWASTGCPTHYAGLKPPAQAAPYVTRSQISNILSATPTPQPYILHQHSRK